MAADIKSRVRNSAEFVLDRDKSIGPIELLVQMGFLHYSHVQQWERGNPRYQSLEPHIQCGEKKLRQTFAEFFAWVKEKQLESFLAEYAGASRSGPSSLQVSADADPDQENFYRTHFRRADLTEKQKARIEKKQNKPPDLVVFQMTSESSECSECSETIHQGEMFMLEQNQPLCLVCADLSHLEYLPKGDATLTRRSKKHSPLSAIVTRFNRRRKRYERQGILVTSESIEAARAQNAGDAEQRAKLRDRAAEQRVKQDAKLVAQMHELILSEFPSCPENEAIQIASHTAERGSGRVGRSAAGRNLDVKAITLAVVARIRHHHTPYDSLLMQGVERQQAREQIREKVDEVLNRWRNAETDD